MRRMKRVFIFSLAVFLILSLAANAEVNRIREATPQANTETKIIKHLVYINVQGLNEKRIKQAYTPNINGLAAGGISTNAIGVLPPNGPSFTGSLLTGADPGIHGYTAPGKRIRTITLPEIVYNYGRKAAFITYPAAKTEGLFKTGKIECIFGERRDNKATAAKAISILKQRRPFITIVDLPGIDEEVIKNGKSAQISKQTSSVDEQIGKILAALRECGVYDETLVVVTGKYYEKSVINCDGEYGSELSVPLIMKGPGIKGGKELPPVKITDITPTVALLTGLQLPPEANGLVLWNALTPGSGFIEENLLIKRVKDLSQENFKINSSIYLLMEEKRLAKNEKEVLDREKAVIQQTIDSKNSQIQGLKWTIRLLISVEIITIIVMSAGYVIEYYYLKKKFLMF